MSENGIETAGVNPRPTTPPRVKRLLRREKVAAKPTDEAL